MTLETKNVFLTSKNVKIKIVRLDTWYYKTVYLYCDEKLLSSNWSTYIAGFVLKDIVTQVWLRAKLVNIWSKQIVAYLAW